MDCIEAAIEPLIAGVGEPRALTVSAADLMKLTVSHFASGRLGIPDRSLSYTVFRALEEIRDTTHQAKVQQARAHLASGDKAEYNRIKKAMPAVSWSAFFPSKRGKEQPYTATGILALDFDHIDYAADARGRIGMDPHVLSVWTTISGKGMRVLVPILTTADHGASFSTARDYFRLKYQLDADEACKDVTRLGFQSWDPAIVVNRLREVTIFSPARPIQSTHLNPENPVSPISAISHVVESVRVQSAIEEALKQKYGGRQWVIYERFFADRPANHGERNAWVVATVTSNYCIVAESILLKLCMAFYDMNTGRYGSGRADHEQEVIAMMVYRAKSYVTELPPQLAEVYVQLDDRKKAAFRICRDMAHRNFKRNGEFEFFMSANELAARLGCQCMEADRILKKLHGANMLDMILRGTRTTPVSQGKATTWKWLLT